MHVGADLGDKVGCGPTLAAPTAPPLEQCPTSIYCADPASCIDIPLAAPTAPPLEQCAGSCDPTLIFLHRPCLLYRHPLSMLNSVQILCCSDFV